MPVATFWQILFGAAFALQVAYWMLLRYGFERAQRSAVPVPEAPLPPVWVVVVARDKAAHLPTLLAALTRQTHPD